MAAHQDKGHVPVNLLPDRHNVGHVGHVYAVYAVSDKANGSVLDVGVGRPKEIDQVVLAQLTDVLGHGGDVQPGPPLGVADEVGIYVDVGHNAQEQGQGQGPVDSLAPVYCSGQLLPELLDGDGSKGEGHWDQSNDAVDLRGIYG